MSKKKNKVLNPEGKIAKPEGIDYFSSKEVKEVLEKSIAIVFQLPDGTLGHAINNKYPPDVVIAYLRMVADVIDRQQGAYMFVNTYMRAMTDIKQNEGIIKQLGNKLKGV